MEFSTNAIVLRLAKVSDHDGILDITKGEDLFGGMDYLPFALKRWLEEAEDEKSNRRNLVFTIDEEIVGFMSVYFQNDGKVGVKFGFRIKGTIRGKGFGKQITNLVGKYLREKYPKLQSTLSLIPDNDLADEEIKSAKHGDLLTVKSVLVYKIPLDQIKLFKLAEDDYSVISKEEFADLLRSNGTKQLLENNLVHMNWVPVLLETEEDIEFAARKKQVVLLEGSLDSPASVSVFTLPYSVPNGDTRTSIDIFAKEKDAIKKHILHQITLFAKRVEEDTTAGETIISIIVAQDKVDAVVEAMELQGLQKFKFVYGLQNRNVANMYLYQKQV